MAEDFGSGVSRTLSAQMRQFSAVVWQKNKPPLDSELNLMSQVQWENLAQSVRAVMPSGFLMDPTRAFANYEFPPNYSNLFKFGNPKASEATPVILANVNGWIIPVAGTAATEGDATNFVALYPPPETDSRVDFVFLEAWQTVVQPNPSTVNKPTSSTLYKYGNVEYGGTQITDDLEDPTIGFETTKRVQTQYRIRVFGSGVGAGESVDLEIYPDGLGDVNVKGQGVNTLPLSGSTYQFTNMAETLGDPSLWRCGDGDPNNDLGTIDGYSYAIPICAIFRRNSNPYAAVISSGNANQNGAFNRQPGTALLPNPRTGAKALLTATLTSAITASQVGTITVTNLNGSALEDTSLVLASTFIVIDGEILGISDVNLVGGTITIPTGGRGRWSSDAIGHAAGAEVGIFNSRPDGLFADEIAAQDVLDLRRAVNPGDWDYQRLLQHSVTALASNELRTAWKKSGAGDSEGVSVQAVDYLLADGTTAVPNQTDALDGPDGIRTIFSDAATLQTDVTLILDNQSPLVGGFTSTQFDANTDWAVAPDFKPVGFMNLGGVITESWTNGSVIFLHSGGNTGSDAARATFRDGAERAVRFVSPREYWKTGYPIVNPNTGNQYPVSLRMLTQRSHEPLAPEELNNDNKHPGPQVPWRDQNFERPFIVLGGLLRSELKNAGRTTANLALIDAPSRTLELDFGVDFDAAGVYYSQDSFGDFEDDPALVANPLLIGSRTLFGMLTGGTHDRTGASSEVYVALYGDDASLNNNGAFKVIGAGTVGYTNRSASSSTGLVLQALNPEWTAVDATGNTFTAEFRSQYTRADFNGSYSGTAPDLAIVLTDIGGLTDHPWNAVTLGQGAAVERDLTLPLDGGTGRVAVPSKIVLNTTLLYNPGRGGTSRVADEIVRVALRNGNSTYLRQNPAVVDTTFASATGLPVNEIEFDHAHIQTWNRLGSKGWAAPAAPGYGGDVVGFTEQDREKELFVDPGSKTVQFRPYRNRGMTLQGMTTSCSRSLLGGWVYPDLITKDAAQIFTQGGTRPSGDPSNGKLMGFPVPQEYMPRFGRQDIPYYVDVNNGTGTFLEGINHLFTDSTDLTENVFSIIGGWDNNTGGLEVNSMFFATASTAGYARWGTVISGVTGSYLHYGARKVPVDLNPADPNAAEIITRLANVHSSDLGAKLTGIQLPPYLGVARLYGIYDARDFSAKGGRTYQSNRVSLEADPATNLMRKDANKQTLFILQDGAKDKTTETGDHTYILPSNAIDITKSPNYVAGEVFEDIEYIVECVVFGFAKNWINANNYVLAREHTGAGVTQLDGGNPHLEGVRMTLPCAASLNDPIYVAYNRTVYQGDPYMTRNGETQTTSDYTHRYGDIPIASARQLAFPIQQNSPITGLPQIETPNLRVFEVLASQDFYTTMGTGSVGGTLFPGTSLDVGFTGYEGHTRIPRDANDPKWPIQTRAFTEGQKGHTNRARASLQILDNDLINPASLDHALVRIKLLDDSVLDLYGTTLANQAALVSDGVAITDQFLVDTDSALHTITVDATVNPGTIASGGTATVILNAGTYPQLTNLDPANQVLFVGKGSAPLSYNAEVTSATEVTVAITHIPRSVYQESFFFDITTIPNILAGAEFTKVVDVVHATVPFSTGVLVSYGTFAGKPVGFDIRAHVSNAGFVSLVFSNNSATAYQPPPTTYTITMFETDDLVVGDLDFTMRVFQSTGDLNVTTNNLINVINGHSVLQGTIKASLEGVGTLLLESVPTGAEGNAIQVGVRTIDRTTGGTGSVLVQNVMTLRTPVDNRRAVGANLTRTNLFGGVDLPVNAGDGTSQLRLTGMTERLPLGILLQDSDFLCENPLGDNASAVKTSPAGMRPVQTQLPLTLGGQEVTRFLGQPGTLIAMADGGVLQYAAAPSVGGSKRFRIYRGGGSVFVLSGPNPGGPIDWVSESFPASSKPVLKGAVLAAKALLVRNFREDALSSVVKFSDGDEIQMVIITYGIFGDGNSVEVGVSLAGSISPTGYGEGYAAADRYRVNGRPMFKGNSRNTPDPAQVVLTPYPENERS